MPAKIVPIHDKSVAQELTEYEDALIAEARRETYGRVLKEMQAACPDPIPRWAGAFMCHLLVESLR